VALYIFMIAPRGVLKQKSEILSNNKLKGKLLRTRDLKGASDSVLYERCPTEDCVWMMLDLDFANVQAYPPKSHPGMVVVFRPESRTASGIAKNDTPRPRTSILIRARLVVQVHPGPPFNSAMNTRLFAFLPVPWTSFKSHFVNP